MIDSNTGHEKATRGYSGRLVVKSFPADAYEILRRLAFDRRQTYAEVIAECLRERVR